MTMRVWTWCCALLITLPLGAFAAPRPATEADLAAMRASGIPNPTVGMLWDPSDPNVGQGVGDAKQWLARHSARHVPVQCFEPTFAKKLQAFMSAVPGGVPTITDGYRDPSKQIGLVRSGASKAGPCVSYHNYGLGADFNSNSRAQTAWMRANASRFGIRTIGSWDPNHFQDARGRFGRCGACSNTSGSGILPGGGGAQPTFGHPATGAMQPPSSPYAQSAREQIPRTNEPAPISREISDAFEPETVLTETKSGEKPETESVAEKLETIASGDAETERVVPVATNTPRLTVTTTDAHRITPTTQGTTSHETPPTPFVPSQTFISPDLAETAPDATPATSFGDMQALLLRLASMLRPFGVRDAVYNIPSPSNDEYYYE